MLKFQLVIFMKQFTANYFIQVFIPILICLSFGELKAQQKPANESQSNLNELGTGRTNLVTTFDNRYQGITGSPYLRENWNKGELQFQKRLVNNVHLKYDIYASSLFIKDAEKVVMISLVSDDWQYFNIELRDKRVMKFKRITYENPKNRKSESAIFEMLVEGPASMVKKRVKILDKADYQGGYSANEYQDEFEDREYLFILLNGKGYRFKGKEKNLLKILSDRQDQISKYIKNEDLNVGDEWNMRRVIRYYNTLVTAE